VLISNFLLPKLVSCAEQILFEGESGRPFPTQRAQLVLGFIFIIYLLNIILQTLVSYSWARNLLKYRETGISQLLCPLCYFENHYWFGAAHSHSAPGSPSHRSPCGMAGDLPRNHSLRAWSIDNAYDSSIVWCFAQYRQACNGLKAQAFLIFPKWISS